MYRRIVIAAVTVLIALSGAVGAQAQPAVQATQPAAVSTASKVRVVTTTHTERLGSLNPQVVGVQYRTSKVAKGNANRVLRKVRVIAPKTLRVNTVAITIHNVVDGREAVWQREAVPVGKWFKVGVVCLGTCAVDTEITATTDGRWWDREHYVMWSGVGE